MKTLTEYVRRRVTIAARVLSCVAMAALLFVLTGDHGVRSAASSGTDPLEILKVQAKPNVILILDSSGSMRETLAHSGDSTTIAAEELVGDDPNSKMYLAKQALKNIVNKNADKVNFSLGQYNDTPGAMDSTQSFYYATTNPNAATLSINTGGTGDSSPGIIRDLSRDNVTIQGTPWYYVRAGRWWNGETVNTSTKAVTAGIKSNPAKVTLTNGAISATFEFKGVYYAKTGGSGGCNGYLNKYPLAPCTRGPLQVTDILPYLDPETLIDANGDYHGYNGTTSTSPPAPTGSTGIRSGGVTPIRKAIYDFRTSVWPGMWASINSGTSGYTYPFLPKTLLIIVTDGDDQCSCGSNMDQNMLAAAYEAQQLFVPLDSSDSVRKAASSVSTYLVAFGAGASMTRANYVAWGGSGLTHGVTSYGTCTGGTKGQGWTTTPALAKCPTCRDAMLASDTTSLEVAIQDAIDRELSQGLFADKSIVASGPEYVSEVLIEGCGSTGPECHGDPSSPDRRYVTDVPILIQSAWQMPGFKGFLQAFTADGAGGSVMRWDAGQKLLARVSGGGTFAQLHGGATDSNIGTSSALIKRRIYTTSGNGVNSAYAPQALVDVSGSLTWQRVALWPPDASVLTGKFDNAMGISNDFAALKSYYGACAGTNAPAACASSDVPTAKKEARQIVLANMAGATLSLDSATGLPLRVGTGSDKGELLYVRKDWMLADGTMSMPALLVPPWPKDLPGFFPLSKHAAEYDLFTDGPSRDLNNGYAVDGIASGFGLSQPDKADKGQPYPETLKPRMSVVLHAANDMFHAFREGPSCNQPGTGTPPSYSSCSEQGGEELWGFVPYDQLSKLVAELHPSTTSKNHVYMTAASPRFAYVWVPGSFSHTFGSGSVSGEGVWRIIAYIARGPGGKYLTALDVTSPGPYTMKSLDTAPPIVVWSRGNDGSEFAGLGETWSVPAIVPVPDGWGTEYVAFVGSGYSDKLSEGTTLYALNALTGDVLYQWDVGNGFGIQNAIVAGPTGFQPRLLAAHPDTNEVTATATVIYFADVNGRVFRVDTANPAAGPQLMSDRTAAQPIGVSLANINAAQPGAPLAYVYGTSGADDRVAPSQAFQAFGLRDDMASQGELFSLAYPLGFRGTLQPALAYADDPSEPGASAPVVMYVATKFNKAETECTSHFDSMLYLVQGATGGAAFALPEEGGRAVTVNNNKITGAVFNSQGVQLAKGIGAATPVPPPTKMGSGTTGTTGSVTLGMPRDPDKALLAPAGMTVFKVGSSVCQQ